VSIDGHAVRRIAALARLAIPDEEIGRRANEMTSLVAALDSLGDIKDLDTVSPNPVPRRLDEERTASMNSCSGPSRVESSRALVVPPMKQPR